MTSPARTYRYELARAVASGVLETAAATFLLFIAVRAFDAGAMTKGWIAAGSGLGYLLTPATVAIAGALGTRTSVAASRLTAVGAIGFATAALFPSLGVFVAASVISLASVSATIPLLTQIYQDAYPDKSRGRMFSRTVMVRTVAAIGFSAAAGHLLAADLGQFRTLLLMFSAACAFSSWCLARLESRPLRVAVSHQPLRMFHFVRSDRTFRVTLISWMFLGFGNLMTVPLRVEYLANPRYGLALTPDMVALLTGVVPNVARLILSPVWGWIFDRSNFFVLRIVLNAGLAAGILTFFTSDTVPGLIIAAIVLGISMSGADVVWSLWVTKIAPPQHVADYMSVHTFLTGTRGMVAPLVAFSLLTRWSMMGVGLAAISSMLVATVMLIPDARRWSPRRRTAEPVTPPLPADQGEV